MLESDKTVRERWGFGATSLTLSTLRGLCCLFASLALVLMSEASRSEVSARWIGSRFQSARLRLGLTTRDMASALGIYRESTVIQLESGEKIPRGILRMLPCVFPEEFGHLRFVRGKLVLPPPDGWRIRVGRKIFLGMTLADFARDIGVSPGTISKWENHLATPEPRSVEALIAKLGYDRLYPPIFTIPRAYFGFRNSFHAAFLIRPPPPSGIALARRESGISQAGLAQYLREAKGLKVSQSTVALWETGEWVPTTAHVLGLETILDPALLYLRRP